MSCKFAQPSKPTPCVRVINATTKTQSQRTNSHVGQSLTIGRVHSTVKSLEIRLCRQAGSSRGPDSRRQMTKLRYSSSQPLTPCSHDKPYIDNLPAPTTANYIFRCLDVPSRRNLCVRLILDKYNIEIKCFYQIQTTYKTVIVDSSDNRTVNFLQY